MLPSTPEPVEEGYDSLTPEKETDGLMDQDLQTLGNILQPSAKSFIGDRYNNQIHKRQAKSKHHQLTDQITCKINVYLMNSSTIVLLVKKHKNIRKKCI